MDDSVRTGSARVPPGQYVTDKWPVLTYGEVPSIDLDDWEFRIFGLVDDAVAWTWDEFQALPRAEVTADFHCVTRFSTLDNPWSGVAKWVSGIELRAEDRRGFWENAGYHAYGDPWQEERFSSQETEHAYQVRRHADELSLTPSDCLSRETP